MTQNCDSICKTILENLVISFVRLCAAYALAKENVDVEGKWCNAGEGMEDPRTNVPVLATFRGAGMHGLFLVPLSENFATFFP